MHFIFDRSTDTQAMLNELRADNLVTGDSNGAYCLKADLETLTELTKRFAETPERFQFTESPYVQSLIDQSFGKLIGHRFKLNFDSQSESVLLLSSKLFPSVLKFSLTADTTRFVNNYEHILRLNLDEEKRKHWSRSILKDFWDQLLIGIERDLREIPSSSDEKPYTGYTLRKQFKIASMKGVLFQIRTDNTVLSVRASGSIKAGELVSYTDVSFLLHAANQLMALEEWDQAIETLDKLLESTEKPELLAAAWTNKSFCLIQKKSYVAALECSDKALTLDPNLSQALSNRELCLKEIEQAADEPTIARNQY